MGSSISKNTNDADASDPKAQGTKAVSTRPFRTSKVPMQECQDNALQDSESTCQTTIDKATAKTTCDNQKTSFIIMKHYQSRHAMQSSFQIHILHELNYKESADIFLQWEESISSLTIHTVVTGSNESRLSYKGAFPPEIIQTLRHFFECQDGVLRLPEVGFCTVVGEPVMAVKGFSCEVAVQGQERNVIGVPKIAVYSLDLKSRNASHQIPYTNDPEDIRRIQLSPDWWSNPPGVLSEEHSDLHSYAAESHRENDSLVAPTQPAKRKNMVWWSILRKEPVDNQLIAKDDFVNSRQEHFLNLQLADDVEPLLRPEEESPASQNKGQKLRAIEGDKRSVADLSKLPEQLNYERNDKYAASGLVVGTNRGKISEASDTVNLPVQTERNEFSTAFTSVQPLTDPVQVIPLPYFINVTRGQEILSFSGSSAVDQQPRLIPDDMTSEKRGAIYPPNFDVPSDVPSVPVQPSESDDRSAVIIDTTNVSMLMKTNFVFSSLLNDTYKSPEPSDTSSGIIEEQDGQLNENPRKFICQICYDREVETVLLPCGHARTCRVCAKQTMQDERKCPFCRGRVNVIQKGVTLNRHV